MVLNVRFSSFKKTLFVVFLCYAILANHWVGSHIWFAFNDSELLVNGSVNPMLFDYLPGKSLNGGIFLRNQDHGTQYLISLSRREVSVISEDEEFLDLGFLTYTHDALADFENPKLKTKLAKPNLVIGNRFVEFSASENERWRFSY
jgi:hypothetical protein